MSSPPSAVHVAAPAVSAEGLVFAYAEGGPRALDGLTLVVPAGSRFALLGPNGAGKSTLLSMVNGLRTPESGTLRLFGAGPDVAARRQVGVVFQESCLDPGDERAGDAGHAGSAVRPARRRDVHAHHRGAGDDGAGGPGGAAVGPALRRAEAAAGAGAGDAARAAPAPSRRAHGGARTPIRAAASGTTSSRSTGRGRPC